MENDIDPREFNSIEDHDKLIKYMIDISILLDKIVILTPENERETVLLKVNKNDVVFSNDFDPFRSWLINYRNCLLI